ncbi:hypothetical protein BGX30_006920 [Mortierella sp. GBA39]|nr:hypothetical protein BGX30_006920 [Mortierella sp. GBA39]
MGVDDGSQALMRPPPAHRSPNSRAKWSPLVHTIAEAGESFSGAVFPAKLFSDDTSNTLSPHDNNTDNRQETHGPSLEGTGTNPLAPSLEPNTSTVAVTTAHEQVEVLPALNGNDEQEEEAIPMDILLREIQRLVAHEFGSPNKSTSYPTVIKPLYQRLQDYHVMLKNARRKLDQHQQQHQQQRGTTHLSPSSEALPPAIANIPTKHSHNTNLLEVPTATTPGSDAYIPQLHQRIIDLEQQLAQSRRAHHTLLQDHILNLKKTSSHFLVGPSASGGFGGAATATLPVLDARAIHGIMASVNSDNSSTPSLFSSSVLGGCGNNKSKKKKRDSSLPRKESGSSDSSVETPNDIFQETLQTAQELHSRHIRQLKGISISTSTSTSTSTSAPSTASSIPSSDSEPSLISISSHNLISEATTRLLRAETELGLLKLVMAQNQSEISGLEEDVFRAQRELKDHRQVFEALLELHHLGFEAQIREDQVLIKELEGKVRKCEGEKEEVERVVKKLEEELEEMERNLNQRRETYQRQELQLTEGPVRDLEAEIEQLKNELAAQETKMAEYRVQSEDEASQMAEFLEKQHRKSTAEFKSSLVKAQRSNTRLHKEVTALVQKMVSVETLNDERRKKDLEETTRNLHELEETMAKLGDAIGMLEYEKEVNLVLVRTLEERDREMRDMEYRLRVLEDERD